MKLLLAVAAVAALLSVASAQTCSSQGVSDSSSCNNKCSGQGSCACVFTDIIGATCECTGTGFIFSCTDLAGNDDFSFGDDDLVVTSCSGDGVTSQSSCSNQCSGNTCTCVFAEISGFSTCSCADGGSYVYSCSDASGTINADDDGAPSAGSVVDILTQFLGESCKSSIKSAVTNSLINCIADAGSEFSALSDDDFDDLDDDAFFTEEQLQDICNNDCVAQVFRSLAILEDASCLPDLSTITGFLGDDDGASSNILSGFAQFAGFAAYQETLGLACTQGGGVFCGTLIDVLGAISADPSAVTAAQCQALVDAGNCLGTIKAAVEVNPSIFGDDDGFEIDVNAFVGNISLACSNQGVSGVDQAAAGTEAPSSIASSSATMVSGIVAAVVAVAAAAIMA
ncbi:hypothetical protein PTSG_11232 [Salpingoeca rosetta]|uniref:EGF-like domain-containing protein n=1 Tax=Salpingoeca rosetta (strain ATCC 50818 / BSB-021) TaxID=946362 RepID=F2UST7_SALR5|nr:uncharacterized protein PTSG_11232 [Salpingoeca rosetta]EGD81196.1 hypothetical protein PTSG_11232 [Salpingoeca rosetta]|eukprot:XP_004987731.1 hypothetical protein PTSG_11232 [Salpingoeca rosetta]